ncbi:MAG: PspA/IM30 family protein, partial [Armatimonadetes bacterium]|nr:PspA/IM30 family protein [Armatimonadota bacterium]
MSLFRELQAAVREGLDELLNAGSSRDDVDHLTSLLESDLLEARSELDTAIEDERRLQSRMESEHRDAERLHEQAQAAVDRGDDEQGRELIRRRRRVLRGVEILETQRGEQRELIALLQDHLEALEDKLQEVQLRRDFLRSR